MGEYRLIIISACLLRLQREMKLRDGWTGYLNEMEMITWEK